MSDTTTARWEYAAQIGVKEFALATIVCTTMQSLVPAGPDRDAVIKTGELIERYVRMEVGRHGWEQAYADAWDIFDDILNAAREVERSMEEEVTPE